MGSSQRRGLPDAQPTGTACFADRNILMLEIANLTNGCTAVDMYLTKLARRQSEECVLALSCHELGTCTSRTHQLCTLADLELNIVYHRADRNIQERQRVARFNIRIRTRNNLIANTETIRSYDITLLAIRLARERRASAAARIVYKS